MIADKELAVGELVEQPGVTHAERQPALLEQALGVRDVLQHPGDLGGGPFWVYLQAGAGGEVGSDASGVQALADIQAAGALPADQVVDRLAGCPVPQQQGFTLVGKPDASDLLRR